MLLVHICSVSTFFVQGTIGTAVAPLNYKIVTAVFALAAQLQCNPDMYSYNVPAFYIVQEITLERYKMATTAFPYGHLIGLETDMFQANQS